MRNNRQVLAGIGCLISLLFLVSPLATAEERTSPPWARYEKALAALKANDYASAIHHLQQSLINWPPAVQDAQQLEKHYVPYFYLSYCYARTGDIRTARAFYAIAQRRGVIYHVDELVSRIRDLEQILSRSPEMANQPRATDSILPVDREAARRFIDASCRVTPAQDPFDLPWYFHYMLGKELLERGRLVTALRSLTLALAKNATPSPKMRTYGMWFIEYRPYYYMTRAFLRLGRRDCALETARQSVRYREIPPDDPEAGTWQRILQELGLH